MKLLRIKAIAVKEMLHIRRDPMSLIMAFLKPILLIIIFGYAITFDINTISTIVYDLDRSSLTRELVSKLRESGYFTIVAYASRDKDIDEALDGGRAKVAVMIPSDFTKKVRAGMVARLGVVVDGSDSNTATIALGYMSSSIEQFSQTLNGGRIVPILESRSRVWYNPDLKSRHFIIPGLIAVIMIVVVVLLTALTVSREWERGSMEQLIATPVRTSELIIGKLLPYLFIGFADTTVAVFMGTIVFGVPFRGDAVLFVALTSIFLFGGLCWGIMISIIARSQVLASQMAMMSTFLPAFLLSGFMFSIWNMPKPLQFFTYLIPARYFVAILKGIFLKGSGLNVLATEAALLSAYAMVVFFVAMKKFRKRVV